MADWNFLKNFFVHSHERLCLALETFDLGIWNDGFLTQKMREEKRYFYPVLHGPSSQQTFVSVNSPGVAAGAYHAFNESDNDECLLLEA